MQGKLSNLHKEGKARASTRSLIKGTLMATQATTINMARTEETGLPVRNEGIASPTKN